MYITDPHFSPKKKSQETSFFSRKNFVKIPFLWVSNIHTQPALYSQEKNLKNRFPVIFVLSVPYLNKNMYKKNPK